MHPSHMYSIALVEYLVANGNSAIKAEILVDTNEYFI